MSNQADDSASNHTSSSNQNANNQLENIKVAVRLRPFTEKERSKNSQRIVDIEQNTIAIYSPKHGDRSAKKFTFDYSYWSHDGFKRDSNGINVPDESHPNYEKYVGQEKVFNDLGQFLLNNALQGYNSALLAYGQTGSGKSYTVSGYGQNEGILPRFARALFEELEKKAQLLDEASLAAAVASVEETIKSGATTELDATATVVEGEEIKSEPAEQDSDQQTSKRHNRYEVYFSMLEIYNEVVRDLLSKNLAGQPNLARRGLKVREHPKRGFFVENLTSYACTNRDEIENKIEEGQLNKSIAATSMNETSSRGHTIYEFRIKQYGLRGPQNAEETLTTSVVQLVDLAGSERMAVHVTSGRVNPIKASGPVAGEMPPTSRSNSPYPRADGRLTATKSFRANPRAPTSASSNSSVATASVGQSSSATLKKTPSTSQAVTSYSLYNNHKQQRFKESVSINQSLSALGNCIQVLSQYSQQQPVDASGKRPRPKLPYRDSVLTKLLNRCCLSGNSKVVIIATLSPSDANYDDTLSTLRFADRAKQIRTHATINRMSRGQIVDALQKENERLKQMIDGRITRSDDSSQTSNFDDTENMLENFNGPKTGDTSNQSIDAVATPIRTRTMRKSRAAQQKTTAAPSTSSKKVGKQTKANSSSTSNLNAGDSEAMKRLVSPASRKMAAAKAQESGKTSNEIKRSRSADRIRSNADFDGSLYDATRELDADDGDLDEDGLLDERELGDIKEGLISSDSDDETSIGTLEMEGMSDEEKIGLFNKLLSNSKVATRIDQQNEMKTPSKRLSRPAKRVIRGQAGAGSISMLSSSLKKSNPYLSNLNQDEQLTGMISYIIKQGETIVGKSNDCDIVLHGPELRPRHAKLTRIVGSKDGEQQDVFIEPLVDGGEVDEQSIELTIKAIALMVNGSRVQKRTRLNHCDRLLFGSNIYFVFIDNANSGRINGDTVANLDMVTFDMARNEVLRKVMSDSKNEAMIKEINSYTHRPGTGKYKSRSEDKSPKTEPARGRELGGVVAAMAPSTVGAVPSLETRRDSKTLKLTRSSTIQDETDQERASPRLTPEGHSFSSPEKIDEESGAASNVEGLDGETMDVSYRERLMEDTYEFAMPVAEINAVAKEMGIKVTYGLKILTGDEQLPDQMDSNYFDSNTSDGLSSSSLGGAGDRANSDKSPTMDERVTVLKKLDSLDIPPALFVQVHLEDQQIDFYWSKEKFQARRFKVLEMYDAWDVGGKSGIVEYLIDQANNQTEYVIDPFVDDPASTIVLVGHAQITLQPIAHLSDIDQNYDVLNLNDEIVGSIRIQAIPCHPTPVDGENNDNLTNQEPYRTYSDSELAKNLLHDPREVLDKRLVFLLKILSCRDIPDKYTNVFCQYTFNREKPIIRTNILRDDSLEIENTSADDNQSVLSFNHSHYIRFDPVNRDVLDFLERGFLTVQVVGQYKLTDRINKSPTFVTTIINSIHKYHFKLDQHSASNSMNYASLYDNNNTDSAKSRRGPSSSGIMNSNSGASSVVSTSATVNLFDQQNEDDEGNSMNGLSQENIIDMILTKRKLDRAENQLHYLKRTINIAEHYNKKHIPVKTVKKLLNSYGQELDSGSLEEMAANGKYRRAEFAGSSCDEI